MYRIGEAETKRIGALLASGKIFRYGMGGECDRFERNWARYLGVEHCRMARSGTAALYTALVGLGVGPGDQVIVPAYTYMATALAVLTAGAIPVIADIDDSLTLCPKDLKKRITKHTRAIIPVHMAGLPCAMKKIMKIAKKNDLLVLEDACQAVGGGYEGKALGSWGHAGAFSFNYFKNMTCGEGGAFVTNDKQAFERGSVAVDCCSFYWNPEEEREDLQFAGHNFRASELEGAVLNVQLRRIKGMLNTMRAHKKELLQVGLDAGLTSIKNNSIDHECGTHLGFVFSGEEEARIYSDELRAQGVGNFLPMDTGRHVYTRWEPIMRYQGAHHPALDPFKLPANKKARIKYSADMCKKSLRILSRSVLIGMHPNHSKARVRKMGEAIREAAA
jgi:dTDP-4-amino-4,6-dideoxygalactose transaminase